ncbi:MAG: sodium/glutamate symporter [Bdellovibrionaceae bacterium]|nr:sodium/glutamate symporter [Pseudobdellovibrionaceae bacterium]
MSFNGLQTLALAAIVIIVGQILVKRIRFLNRYNFPSPVVGGLLFALVFFVAKEYFGAEIKFEKTFQEPLMIAFFASLGFGASWISLKKGGKDVLFFLFLSVVFLVAQIALGIGIAVAMDMPSISGILMSSVALAGGPGTSLAFAPLFESAGVTNAATLGLTTALGGILMGGVLGTPLATYLIGRDNLSVSGRFVKHREVKIISKETEDLPFSEIGIEAQEKMNPDTFIKHVLALILFVGLGTYVSPLFAQIGVTLPIYIGSMIVAAIIRNMDDQSQWFGLKEETLEELGNTSLSVFIAMAIVTLDLSQLKNAALPVIVSLVLQGVLVVLGSLFLVYKFMGKSYDSAIISSGFVGFMMGTTANALANMSSLTRTYGISPRAFLIVPLVGSCFIDFINAAFITTLLNLLK